MPFGPRLKFAARYAVIHMLISITIAVLSALVVFGLWYPSPYRQMLGVEHIYLLILVVDVCCGPLLTLLLTSPTKSRRARHVDFSLIGLIQLLALAYGMFSVWGARPVVVAFEVDRLNVVTANEVQVNKLALAPPGLRQLPRVGVLKLGTQRPPGVNPLEALQEGLARLSPGMLPGWWVPRAEAHAAMRQRAKPLPELIARRPDARTLLRDAAAKTGQAPEALYYLPLTSSKTYDWVALLDDDMHVVGYAPVNGFPEQASGP